MCVCKPDRASGKISEKSVSFHESTDMSVSPVNHHAYFVTVNEKHLCSIVGGSVD